MKLKRASIFTKIIIAALILYACVSLMSLGLRTADAILARDELRAQVELAAEENQRLSTTGEHADDLEALRRIAEDKLGFTSAQK